MALNQFPRRAFSGAATLQTFTGDGSTTTFTLSQAQYQNECFVYVDDVAQVPVTDYGINSTTLTFTSAPANGSEIIVRGFGVPTPLNSVSDGSITSAKLATGAIEAKLGYTPVSPTQLSTEVNNIIAGAPGALNTLDELAAALNDDANYAATITTALGTKANISSPTFTGDVTINSTSAFKLPTGTIAQRPASPTVGMIRYNTDKSEYEIYDDSEWKPLTQGSYVYSTEYLVIGGGGSGSAAGGVGGGGGGAGGYIASSAILTIGQSYTITVGGGGPGGSNLNANGNPSAINSIVTATGGGAGSGASTLPGPNNGGSGGGGGSSNSPGPGSGTAGQGNRGGDSPDVWQGGGGGGAGSAGGSSDGGDGLNWQSLGTFRAAGGGAGRNTWQGGGSPGSGGNGGGGSGGYRTSVSSEVNGGDGTANTGSGGGGGGRSIGGSGGSGIVIIRYAGSQRGTGGSVTSSGGYTYHTFTTSGTFTA